jgi:hypothetical protein
MKIHRHRRAARADRPALGTEISAWIKDDRLFFSSCAVGSLVPAVFEAYARVLHPAWAARDVPVRWETVARWSGSVMHPLAQWESISLPVGSAAGRAPFVQQPRLGALPQNQLAKLCELLASYTATADLCYAGYWEGDGSVPYSDLDGALELALEERTFLVRTCSIETGVEVTWRLPGGIVGSLLPTLIWPSDRAWFVATDPDQDSTLVGGSGTLVAALLDYPGFEVWPVAAGDLTLCDDPINGPSASQ